MSTEEQQPQSRRGFFRALKDWAVEETREVATPLVEGALEKYEPLIAEMQGPQLLRPPGAGVESEFMDLCEKCGKCIAACPENAILPVQDRHFEGKEGTPWINARRRACHSCEPLHCAVACPSGALKPIPTAEMKLGVASVYASMCFAHQGEVCDTCYAVCPEQGKAIEMIKGKPVVTPDSCTGCGMCEYACPAHPAAIRVLSKR